MTRPIGRTGWSTNGSIGRYTPPADRLPLTPAERAERERIIDATPARPSGGPFPLYTLCGAVYTGAATWPGGRPIRCNAERGHVERDGTRHGNSLAARYWD